MAGGPETVVTVKDGSNEDWLQEWLTPGLDTLATLSMCREYLTNSGKIGNRWYSRMAHEYRLRWPDLHKASKEKIQKALEGFRLTSFTPGDVVDYIHAVVPQQALVISFPPTYEGGYEKLYKRMDEVLSWDAPTYDVFNDLRFAEFTAALQSKDHWITIRDNDVEALRPFLIARSKATPRARTVYMYADTAGEILLTQPRQSLEPFPYPRLHGELTEPLRLVIISQAQLNTLRSQYLSVGIAPASAYVSMALMSGNHLIGCLSFKRAELDQELNEAYMMSDFVIRPSIYPKLSKLVVMAALSTEAKAVLETTFNRQLAAINTTAFTDKPVSMKYRGVMRLAGRSKGKLAYRELTGKWSLAEGLEQWKTKYGQVRPDAAVE
jgi:hypothetical protein